MQILTQLASASALALLTSAMPAVQPSTPTAPAPAPSTNQTATVSPATPATPAPDAIITVQIGDSLTKIALANNTTWQRLYDKNTGISDPDLIYPGETLTIPASDETLADRPLPAPPAPAVSAPVETPSTSADTSEVSAASSVSAPVAPSGSVWDRIAACESSGNWSTNTGNGFYGGLQFTLSSWEAVGGTGLPSNASRDEQIMRAQMLQARQGWGAWPVCSVRAGV